MLGRTHPVVQRSFACQVPELSRDVPPIGRRPTSYSAPPWQNLAACCLPKESCTGFPRSTCRSLSGVGSSRWPPLGALNDRPWPRTPRAGKSQRRRPLRPVRTSACAQNGIPAAGGSGGGGTLLPGSAPPLTRVRFVGFAQRVL